MCRSSSFIFAFWALRFSLPIIPVNHCKHNRHHAIHLFIVVLQTSQGQTAKRRGNASLRYYTFLVF